MSGVMKVMYNTLDTYLDILNINKSSAGLKGICTVLEKIVRLPEQNLDVRPITQPAHLVPSHIPHCF